MKGLKIGPNLLQIVENSVFRPVKRVLDARRERDRSFGLAQDGLGGGILMQYVEGGFKERRFWDAALTNNIWE